MIAPPLAIYNADLARAIGKAYRLAYRQNAKSAPHDAGMGAAKMAFWKRFPYTNPETVGVSVDGILASIDAEHPGWLRSDMTLDQRTPFIAGSAEKILYGDR